MLEAWDNHKYDGDPIFSTEGDPATVLIIATNSNDDRGSWMAYWQEPISEGDQFTVSGAWAIGEVKVLYYSGGEYMYSEQVTEPGQVVTVPAGADRLRLDCRFWNMIGTARFENMAITPYQAPSGNIPIPEPVEPPALVPMVGIQWGPYYWLAEAPITPGEPLPTFPPAPGNDEYFTLQGYKIGRNVTLEIIHPAPVTDNNKE